MGRDLQPELFESATLVLDTPGPAVSPPSRRVWARWADTWHILRLAGRPGRLINGLLLGLSYLVSRWLGRPVVWGGPAAFSLEPTTSCNLRCPECPSGLRSFSRPTGMASVGDAGLWMEQLSQTAFYLNLYFQGEPYLHKGFFDLVELAGRHGLYTATSTNAHYLTDAAAQRTVASGLSRLIISLDGTTQDTYQAYRVGGSLEKVLAGTRRLVAARAQAQSATPYLIMQFLVVGPNEHQMEDARRLAAELGVDEIRFKTAQIYDYAHGSELMPQQDRYNRYRKGPDGLYQPKAGLANRCWRMWTSTVITWDGRVVPCCFDKDAEHQMGSLAEGKSFRQIWHSPAYQAFRRTLLHSRSQIEMCKNCTEGGEVFA